MEYGKSQLRKPDYTEATKVYIECAEIADKYPPLHDGYSSVKTTSIPNIVSLGA